MILRNLLDPEFFFEPVLHSEYDLFKKIRISTPNSNHEFVLKSKEGHFDSPF